MALVNQNFSAEFILNTTPPKLKVTDLTDYAGQGAGGADIVRSLLKIVDPSGAIIYKHAAYDDAVPATADMLPLAGGVNLYKEVTLPVGSDNLVPQGNYTVYMKTYIEEDGGGVLDGTYIKEKTFNFCPVYPEVKISVAVNCVCGSYTSVDDTDYTQSDSTSNVITRTHTVMFPPSLELANVVAATATLEVTPLYTKTWTSKISSIVTWTYADQWYITNTITGSVEKDVSCEKSLCDVYCQIWSLEERYQDELRTNPAEAVKTERRLAIVTHYMTMIRMAMECAETDDIDGLLDKIYKVGQFKSGCCEGDEPTLIAGCGGGESGDFTFLAGAAMNVSVVVVGDATTVTYKLMDSYKSKVDAMKILTFDTDTPTRVTLTPVIDGDNETLTIDVASELGNNVITTAMVQNSAITADKLAANAVTTVKILDANVTTAKIADLNVTTAKMALLSVTTAVINDLAVTEGKIAALAVTNGKIGALAVDAAKIAADAVTTAKILDGNVTLAKLAANSVDASKIVDLSVGTNELADGAVTTVKLGLLSVDSTILTADAVTTAKIAALQVTDAKLAANAVTEAKVANGAITVDKIGANAVVEAKILDGAVTVNKIGAAAVTIPKLSTDLQYEQDRFTASFETGEKGVFNVYWPYKVTVIEVRGVVVKALAAVDDGEVRFANGTGDMGGAGLDFPASSAFGYEAVLYNPAVNNVINAGSAMIITSSKTTAGGKALISVTVQRTA